MKRFLSKKVLAIFLCCTLFVGTAAGCGSGTDSDAKTTSTATYASLFEKDSVLDIYLEIDDADWQNMLDNPTAEEYHSANLTIGDTTLHNIAIRTKGNMTLRAVADSDSDRYSFRLNLGKYEKNQTLSGLDELVLNNMYSDPSYMREYLSYEALRELGAKVPLASFANVYINDELFGFYLCVEAIDKSFLETNFGNTNGNLYKANERSTLVYEEGSQYDTLELQKGDDNAKDGLKTLIERLNNMPAGEKGDIESILDVNSALMYIAANTVLGNYDSYNGNMHHNYYLYEDNGKFTVIPWDYNMSFGGFGGGDQTTIPIDEPVLGDPLESLPLIKNLLAVPEYLETYHGYIETLTDNLDKMESRVNELANTIRPYVEADPTKFCTMEQFESAIVYAKASSSQAQENSIQESPPPSGAEVEHANVPAPPTNNSQGNRPGQPMGQRNGDERRGPGGGVTMTSNISIVTYAKDRAENIRQQLSGELPTTGNTTINQNKGSGGFPPGQGPGEQAQPPEPAA